jgi:hypothetical protein
MKKALMLLVMGALVSGVAAYAAGRTKPVEDQQQRPPAPRQH